jgi:hypothetical protein
MCKNYQAAREGVFTQDARVLFERLGIDWHREIEVLHTHRIARGRHAYEGLFHLFGKLEGGKDAHVPRGGGVFAVELEACGDTMSLGFTTDLSSVSAAWINAPVLQIDFVAIVPWVLEIDEPS